MNKYELAVVLSATLEEEERAAAIEKVQGYITRYNGVVTNVDDWGKRKLAYLINDEAEGYYVFTTFESAPEFPAELERVFGITDGILRNIVIKKEEN